MGRIVEQARHAWCPLDEEASDMTDELLPVEGISRRDLLKRSAIVGGAGAMVWAAPSLTTLAPRAFGADGTKIQGFSYAAAVVKCGAGDDSRWFRVKYQKDEGGFENQPDGLPGCETTKFKTDLWDKAEKVSPVEKDVNPGEWDIDGIAFSITVSQLGDELRFTLDAASACVFAGTSAEGGVTKEGTLDCNTTVTNDGKVLRFDLSAFDA